MLDYVAPFGIDDLIRSLSLLLPMPWPIFGFGVIFAAYLIVLTRVVTHLFFRLEFLVTTHFRRSRRSIPDTIFWLDGVFNKLPGAAALFAVVVVVASGLCSSSTVAGTTADGHEVSAQRVACDFMAWLWE